MKEKTARRFINRHMYHIARYKEFGGKASFIRRVKKCFKCLGLPCPRYI